MEAPPEVEPLPSPDIFLASDFPPEFDVYQQDRGKRCFYIKPTSFAFFMKEANLIIAETAEPSVQGAEQCSGKRAHRSPYGSVQDSAESQYID